MKCLDCGYVYTDSERGCPRCFFPAKLPVYAPGVVSDDGNTMRMSFIIGDDTPTRAASGHSTPSHPVDRPSALLRRLQTPVDIVLFLDATGSMEWCFAELADNICKFTEDLSRNRLDWRMALYAFRDLQKGEPPEYHEFTTDVRLIEQQVRSKKADGGGGNWGESSIDALFDGIVQYEFRPSSTVVFLLFTDEPPHDPDQSGRSMSDLIEELRSRRIVPYVVSRPLETFYRLANSNAGLHFDIEKTRGAFRRVLLDVGQSVAAASLHEDSLRDAAAAALLEPEGARFRRIRGSS